MSKLKSEKDFEKMREAGRLAALTLQHVAPLARPGATTEEINTAVHEFVVSHGAYPSPLNYRGFPKSVCTSVNDVICHGIPSNYHVLQEGDIVNIDVTVTLNGYFGDTSRTFFVGNKIPPERRKVTEVAEEALALGIAAVKDGGRIGDIGWAIQNYVDVTGCSVVRDFVGHGIGKVFHEDPAVPHYGRPGSGPRIVKGMCFTIEPMINGGDWRSRVLGDGWTAVTTDGQPSAQFEHTLGLGENGLEILTALPNDPILKRVRELGVSIAWPPQEK